MRLDDTFMSSAIRGREEQLILSEYGQNVDILIENVKMGRTEYKYALLGKKRLGCNILLLSCCLSIPYLIVW